MRLENIPVYIRNHASSDLIVEFEDGDRYPASALDLQGENEEGEFEIVVFFNDCFGKSNAYAEAVEAGSFERSPAGVWWSSDKPRQPVGKRYTLDQVKSVQDKDADYFVYERESGG
jgi:hypothetical protein